MIFHHIYISNTLICSVLSICKNYLNIKNLFLLKKKKKIRCFWILQTASICDEVSQSATI